MSGWSVSRRIYAGFGAILALLLLLAAIAYWQGSVLSRIFTDYRDSARKTLAISGVEQDVFETRVAAFAFRAAPSAERAEAVRANVAEVTEGRAELAALFAEDPEAGRVIGAVARDLAAYREAFDRLAELGRRKDALVAEVDAAAVEAATRLERISVGASAFGDGEAAMMASKAADHLVRARMLAKTYLQAYDPETMGQAQQHAQGVLDRLDSLVRDGDPGEDLQVARAEAESFAQGLATLGEVVAERRDISDNRLDMLGPRMSADIETLLERIETRQARLGPEGARSVASVKTVIIAVSIGAALVGAVLALLVARSIVRSVSGMAGTMTRLAEGDLEVEIAGTGQGHELGRMARALESFRENARKVRRLAEEKEAQDRAAAAERARMMGELQEAFGSVVAAAVEGDFSRRVTAEFPDAELNELAAAVNRLVETVEAGVEASRGVMNRMAQGDLEGEMAGDFRGAFAELQANVNATLTRFRDLVSQIRRTSADVGASAADISNGAAQLSGRVEQQASALQQTAATMEEMSATVKTNAENAGAVRDLATEATGRADKGRGIVEEAVGAMSRIEEGAQKISDIISVIDGIAFQTNLLALNAAVEAARAGEAGKGFAVVASEVRSLAQRSSEAARDIRGLIETSSAQVSDGVRLVEQAGAALSDIVDSVRQVAETIEGITGASREQASGIEEISSTVSHMDQMTQENAALAQQSSTNARAMEEHAAALDRQIGFFATRDWDRRAGEAGDPRGAGQAAAA